MTPISEDIIMLRLAHRVLKNPNCLDVLSRGEIAMVAFTLNRPEYLKQAGFTMAQALGRMEQFEIEAIEYAAHELHHLIN